MMQIIDARPLGVARIIVGLAALIRGVVALDILSRFDGPDIVRMPVLGWLPDPGSAAALVLVLVWIAAAIGFAVGWKVTMTGSTLAATIAAYLTLDYQTYSNHLYLLVLLVILLVVADAGAAHTSRPHRPVPLWPVTLIKVQISLVYFFSPSPSSTTTSSPVGCWSARCEMAWSSCRPGCEHPPSWVRSLRPPSSRSCSWRYSSGALGSARPHSLLVSDCTAQSPCSSDPRPSYSCSRCSCSAHIRSSSGVARSRWCGKTNAVRAEPGSTDLLGSTRWDCWKRLARATRLTESTPQPFHTRCTSSLRRLIRALPAVTQILERTIPSLWLAPLLRLPGIRHLGDRWYRWQAERRSCGLG